MPGYGRLVFSRPVPLKEKERGGGGTVGRRSLVFRDVFFLVRTTNNKCVLHSVT